MATSNTADLAVLWPAAGILVAFQTAVLTLRINREIDVSKQGDITWLPLADWLNIFSILAILLGVFAARALDIVSSALAVQFFAVAALLLAGYPIALAGHYDMLTPKSTRSMRFCTLQEIIAITVVACVSVSLLIWADAALGVIVVYVLFALAIAAYGWWQVVDTYVDTRKEREETAKIVKSFNEVTAVLREENEMFMQKVTDIQRRYNAILDEIRTTSEEEVSHRRLLRTRKDRVFEELLTWEADVRQIQASLDLLFKRPGEEKTNESQVSRPTPYLMTGEVMRESLRRMRARQIYERRKTLPGSHLSRTT